MPFKVMAAMAIVLAPLVSAQADSGAAITWQNSHGSWFACGPVQCTSVGERDEAIALDLVLIDNKHSATRMPQYYGRCSLFTVNGVTNSDNSGSWVVSQAERYCN